MTLLFPGMLAFLNCEVTCACKGTSEGECLGKGHKKVHVVESYYNCLELWTTEQVDSREGGRAWRGCICSVHSFPTWMISCEAILCMSRLVLHMRTMHKYSFIHLWVWENPLFCCPLHPEHFCDQLCWDITARNSVTSSKCHTICTLQVKGSAPQSCPPPLLMPITSSGCHLCL